MSLKMTRLEVPLGESELGGRHLGLNKNGIPVLCPQCGGRFFQTTPLLII